MRQAVQRPAYPGFSLLSSYYHLIKILTGFMLCSSAFALFEITPTES